MRLFGRALGPPGSNRNTRGSPSSRSATRLWASTPGGQVSVFWPKPVTFNPLFSTAGAEQGIEQLLLGALVKVNDKLEAVPDIAEKIDVSSDARTYTFHLKNTLKFTDGQALTARDVVFTIQRAVDAHRQLLAGSAAADRRRDGLW